MDGGSKEFLPEVLINGGLIFCLFAIVKFR